MKPYKTVTVENIGYTATIRCHFDDNMEPPWKEHDGHGPVSEWTTRDKRPGEWLMDSDRGFRMYYDAEEATRIAKRDGWGIGPEKMAALTSRLGRQPTHGEVIAEAVRLDFERLQAWCDNQWHWVGFTTEIETPDGETVDGESCWGFDDESYMLQEANDSANYTIARLEKIRLETQLAECCP